MPITTSAPVSWLPMRSRSRYNGSFFRYHGVCSSKNAALQWLHAFQTNVSPDALRSSICAWNNALTLEVSVSKLMVCWTHSPLPSPPASGLGCAGKPMIFCNAITYHRTEKAWNVFPPEDTFGEGGGIFIFNHTSLVSRLCPLRTYFGTCMYGLILLALGTRDVFISMCMDPETRKIGQVLSISSCVAVRVVVDNKLGCVSSCQLWPKHGRK